MLHMSDLPITYRGTVYPWHCDHMGHMNVMWYVGKFDEATWQPLFLIGASRDRLAADGCGMAALEQHIDYECELRAGDVITIRSEIIELRNKVVRFRHVMTNDGTGEVSATTTLVGVHFDLAARKAKPLPDDIREKALAHMRQSTRTDAAIV